MKMKGQLNVKSPAEYIATVDEKRRSDIAALYCFAADEKGDVAERYVDRLPKASIGKTCVQIKKLADLDEKALAALIKETAKMGLVA